ncbi:MAG TPA: flagellar hook-associated protein FlgL [candidate division Zixibacteria bacterium]|nr:flagellar hook-associated protein FlgL [candidate division Zixibacteria bacterium]MDD4917160.1 flagellar hook-associated protein FlgL [candidate division Zixibacteria bacterium]MDM7973255.1 flagellar hook-associated protein FlgL [candidate division Zixibacteria bacterium]HOD65428.1 flagellar hook-associated protein FlgL [candidate division Zixibacteria bacterium]HPC10766.1 flagellar hook-associated protein FlgL [candidate division Zixibacteria bacterium]
MRISTNMLNDRVVFNMQRSLARFLRLETQMSSGRRINQPSDDPVGTQRDLGYRTELAKGEQYRSNIEQAQTWMQSYDTILGDLKDIVSSAKEIAVAMANGVYDDVTRNGAAAEVESLYERILQLATSELEGRQVFSGHRTTTKALTSTATGVVYRGDTGQIDYQIEASARLTVNLIGSEVFLRQLRPVGAEADLDAGVSGGTLVADLHNGAGIDTAPGTFTITDLNLGLTSTIDVSGAATLNDVIAAINAQLAADGITSLTARPGAEGNNLMLDTSETGLISAATALARLNSGNGVDLQPGQIRVTDGAGINEVIDFSGAATVGDIIAAFNAHMSAAGYGGVTMGLNAAGTGLAITDAGAPPLGLRIEEVAPDQTTAANLGLAGTVGSLLVGADLAPTAAFRVAETTGTTATDLGLAGDITGDFAGNDLDPRLQPTTPLASLQHGLGLGEGEIVLRQGERTRTIALDAPGMVTVQDLIDALNGCGLDITAAINAGGRGIQIDNNDSTRSLVVADVGNGRAAKALGVWGGADLMGSMLLLIESLRADDQEGTGRLLQNLDDGIEHLLNQRASVGARDIRLERTHSRLTDLELGFTKLLSEVEDADMTKLVTDLATYENNYQAALMASARIIQPSLLDFLQ